MSQSELPSAREKAGRTDRLGTRFSSRLAFMYSHPGWVAILLAIGSTVAGQYQLHSGRLAVGAVLYVVGTAFMFIALRVGTPDVFAPFLPWHGRSHATASEQVDFGSPIRQGIEWGSLAVGVLLAATAWLWLDLERPSEGAWWTYAAGVCLVVIGAVVSAAQRPVSRHSAGWSDLRLTRLLLLAVLILAMVLRVYQLDVLPFGTWYDEAANGLEALRVANEPHFRPVYNAGVNAAGHYLFLIVLFFQWFGVETESIRLISALMGVGLVLAAYGVGTELLDRWGGLIFALLIAVAHWAVNFSRIGMYNISTPLLALGALYFLLRGVRGGRAGDFALAGVCAGLGMTFYSAYYLFAPVLGVVLGVAVIRSLVWRTADGPTGAVAQAVMVNKSCSLPTRMLLGALAFLCAFGVTLAPIAKFALERPEVYFGRVRTTSLLGRVATEELAGALARNTGQHLLMFHLQGDPNGRHNLPGRPMLDPLTSALMVLGLAICVARLRSLFSWLLPLWLISALLGGILSLDFESPQSLRSIGALPPALLLATLPLVVLLQSVVRAEQSAARIQAAKWLPVGTAAAVVLMLGLISFQNVRMYFVEQARDFAVWNAFSTPETIAASVLRTTPGMATGETIAYVTSLYDGHPTLRFLAGESGLVHRLETTDTLPILSPPKRAILLIADAERAYFYEEARRLYPNATFETYQPPFGGPTILYTVYLPPETQASLHGASARYVSDDGGGVADVTLPGRLGIMADSPLLAEWLDAPGDGATGALVRGLDVEWSATLMVPSYGPHLFYIDDYLDDAEHVELWIGDERVGAMTQGDSALASEVPEALVMAQGAHSLRLRAEGVIPGGNGEIKVYWRPPDREWEEIPDWILYRDAIQPQGLLGSYFPNGEWSPPAAFERIDGRWEMYFHVLPLARPYTVEWTGSLLVSEPGEYGLGVQSRDESSLWLNGEEVAHSPGAGVAAIGHLLLRAGTHDIRIRYADRTHHTGFRLFWEPPAGTGRTTIPAEHLLPPRTGYGRIEVPQASTEGVSGAIARSESQTEGAADSDIVVMAAESVPVLAVEVEVVVSELDEPTTVAVAPDQTLWIAEPVLGRVRGFDTGGNEIFVLTHAGGEAMVEPYAVAVDDQGQLYVLDSGAGRLSRLDISGNLLVLPVEQDLLERSRGLTVDGRDLWIVATSRGELVQLNDAGEVRARVGLRVGGAVWQDAQPTSLALPHSSGMLVADPGLSRLVSYTSAGERVLAWEIPVANTFTAPQLAIGNDGFIYRSVPEEGKIVVHHASGEPVATLGLRSHELPAVRPVGLASVESGIIWVVDAHGGALLRVKVSIPHEFDIE